MSIRICNNADATQHLKENPTRKGADFSSPSPNHQYPRSGDSQNLIEDSVKSSRAVRQKVRLPLQHFGESVKERPSVAWHELGGQCSLHSRNTLGMAEGDRASALYIADYDRRYSGAKTSVLNQRLQNLVASIFL